MAQSNAVEKIRQLRANAPKAIARALNRSITSGRLVLAKEIVADSTLQASYVRENLVISEATEKQQVARVRASFRRIPLMKFGAKGPVPTRGRGRGVTAKLGKARGRYPDAFIASFKSGHVGVFKRLGVSERKSAGAWSKNLPITELHGPSLARVAEKYVEPALARTKEQFEKNLASELRFATR